MRRLIEFPCEGETLVGTLDDATGRTGLLIVSGGNEIRIGAHRGMARLAAAVARAGYPVLRFDRRGIGDSSGENGGFLSSADDIAAAAAALRAETGVARVIGFGNCDAASALGLYHTAACLDGVILANPWSLEGEGALPPPAAIRARYAARLRDPRQWLRLVTGRVNLAKLFGGLRKLARRRAAADNGLVARMGSALEGSGTPITLLMASGDNTAIAFLDAWIHAPFDGVRDRAVVEMRDTPSHSFARAGDAEWLAERVLAALSR